MPLKSKELTKQEESFHHPGLLFQPLKTLTSVIATVYILPYLWFPHKKSKLFAFLFKGQISEDNNHMRKDELSFCCRFWTRMQSKAKCSLPYPDSDHFLIALKEGLILILKAGFNTMKEVRSLTIISNSLHWWVRTGKLGNRNWTSFSYD